jgi:hypothetical protein
MSFALTPMNFGELNQMDTLADFVELNQMGILADFVKLNQMGILVAEVMFQSISVEIEGIAPKVADPRKETRTVQLAVKS